MPALVLGSVPVFSLVAVGLEVVALLAVAVLVLVVPEVRSDFRSSAKLESRLPPLLDVLDAGLPVVVLPEDDGDDQASRLDRMLLIDMAGPSRSQSRYRLVAFATAVPVHNDTGNADTPPCIGMLCGDLWFGPGISCRVLA